LSAAPGTPARVEIPILHRGRAFAVVDKPAGLAVEADGEASVVKQLARQLGPPGGRAFPRVVHRLDTDTSGCLLIALSDAARAALEKTFEAGAVEKEYLALVAGAPPETGAFDTAYGPDPRDRRRFTTRLQTPRRARLSFALVERFAEVSLLRVKLDTGRTHQIRVQLAEGGFPVLGDRTYGTPESAALAVAAGLGRHALHAVALALLDPESGAWLHCEAPLPADLETTLAGLRGGSRSTP
jgi:23S rRNA pseudouridine1911/1915/1917 synthase